MKPFYRSILCLAVIGAFAGPAAAATYEYQQPAKGINPQAAPAYGPWSLPTFIIGASPVTLTPPSSTSTAPFTYSSSNPGVVSVANGVLSIHSKGSATITATQAATSTFVRGSATAVATVTDPVCGSDPVVFSTKGTVAYTVPAGCNSMTAKVWGAGGGAAANGQYGGGAGFGKATFTVAAGTQLRIDIGAPGTTGGGVVANGGGAAGSSNVGSGGGYSGIFVGSAPWVVAGGGGGGALGGAGAGGGTSGQTPSTFFSGTAGTQNSGFAPYTGGPGNVNSVDGGGGGGAGYYGGNGGTRIFYANMWIYAPGGGGSGYVSPAGTNALLETGAYQGPAAASDPDRATAGNGGMATNIPGQAGRVVLRFQP